MNILITLSKKYAQFAMIMLESLFEHNKSSDIHIYCLYKNMEGHEREQLRNFVDDRKSHIIFLYVDDSVYEEFPVTSGLPIECYYSCLAHLILPKNMERILYLDVDLIITGNLDSLYTINLGNYYLAAAGQSYKEIEGNFYKLGASPVNGECFNSGVVLFNLENMRRDITAKTYLDAAKQCGYNFNLADQGILNIVFYDKALYLDTMEYNFRMGIYREYLRDGNPKVEKIPKIVHFNWHDYYSIGIGTKPWTCTLSKMETRLLNMAGSIKNEYGMKDWHEMNRKIHVAFWKYAKRASVHVSMWRNMKLEKRKMLGRLVDWGTPLRLHERIERQRNRETCFKSITNNDYSAITDFEKYTYRDLEQYVDSLDIETAIKTLRNWHRMNFGIFSQKNVVRIGFLVYSSSEWQCDALYWKLEADKRFEPVIIICGYNHGTQETIRRTYFDTGKYFRESGRSYRVRNAGYVGYSCHDKASDCDILVYLTPHYQVLHPFYLNLNERPLTQLAIHIPYGFYLESKQYAFYGDSFYDATVFKMSFAYFCENNMQQKEVQSEQRLNGYNVVMSGMPKIDSLLKIKSVDASRIWCLSEETKVKVIWAPHFNMEEGMNGTFHENCNWFYEFARDNPDTSWIVRPHPRIIVGALKKGVFKCIEELNKYFDDWNNLSNAKVVMAGDYYDIFFSSDCMVLDSLSFLAEYQYTGKPLLRLLPKKPRKMNELGDALNDISYTARGNDFEKIQEFIEKVKEKKDTRKRERAEFFMKYLNYEQLNKSSATDKIYSILVSNIDGHLM